MPEHAPAPARAAASSTRRTPAVHRWGGPAAVAVLTLATVLLPGATAPGVPASTAAAGASPTSATPASTALTTSAGRLASRLDDDGAGRGSKKRLTVDWGDLTPVQGQSFTIRGSAPVPSNRATRLVYLEERVAGTNVWGYVKDTRASASGAFSLSLTLNRVNEPRRFRIVVEKAPGAPALVSPQATFSAVWQPAEPRTVTYPGLTVVWPGAQVLVGSRQTVAGTLTARLADATVALQRQVGGQWTTLTTAPVTGSGSFSVELPTTYLSRAAVRLRVAGAGTGAVETPAQDVDVIPAYTPAGPASSYAFVSTDPIGRWDPCTPIQYRLNTAKAPAGVLADVQAALTQVSQATGLRFEYRGQTSVVPFAAGNTFDPAVADLVIAWADPAQMRGLFPAGTLGVGGPEFRSTPAVDPSGRRVRQIYQGGVTINTAFNKALKPGSGEGLTRVAALMHEIGHAVGLMHVTTDDTQMMATSIGYGLDQWGAGDLAGLELVGAGGGCVTPVS